LMLFWNNAGRNSKERRFKNLQPSKPKAHPTGALKKLMLSSLKSITRSFWERGLFLNLSPFPKKT